LGLGVFLCGVTGVHAGRTRTPHGSRGRCCATGLYSLIGLCAYPLVAGVLLLAVRMCRARRLIEDVVGALGSWHCCVQRPSFSTFPLPASRSLARPGRMLGQWLAETGASAVGGVGAALAAATLLSISLILLTHVSVGEVFTALAWAARGAGRAIRASLALRPGWP